jgi:polyamine oxidase
MALGRLLNLLAFSPWGSLYNEPRQAQVIILGGGVAGISLARALIADNITDILLLEGRDELGGRAYTETLHNCITGQDIVVEKGCNWIQGPGKEPIIALADKWGIKTTRQNYSDTAWFGDYDGDAQRGGHWLDEEEEDAFMDEYDSFLQRAPAYSGEGRLGRAVC